MLSAEAGYVFMGFILYITGAQGQQKTVCALKGSTVRLPCSAEHPTSSMKWFTEHRDGSQLLRNKLFADRRATSNMSEDGNFSLTINDLRESDAKFYCCRKNKDNPQKCSPSAIKLQVTDLQVKVIPTTEDQTVTLMCSSSCSLNEKPVAYIWYKNREFLYEDWSPWYQELVSSEEGVTYSCAIKGYKDLRAPEVSVDSVTSTCFNVTYAKGRMCSYQQKSEHEPCSITYPKEVRVIKTPVQQSHVTLTCSTSCPQTDNQTVLRWYKNRQYEKDPLSPLPSSSTDTFSCAVNDHEDLTSADICVGKKNCWSVNYASRRICALKGSSVNISGEYSHPENQQPDSKFWYKIKRSSTVEAEKVTETAGRVTYHDDMKNQHILTINKLTKNDSAEYTLRVLSDDEDEEKSNFTGVTLVVTGLRVKFTPSAVVTEGQRVTLTCSTSCPLSEKTNYMWSLNKQPLTAPQNQSKHLVLDPVSSQHAGRYVCSVKFSKRSISTSEVTLTVLSITGQQTLTAAAAGAGVVLLVIILLTVFLWIRRKRNSHQSPRAETSGYTEQLNPGPVYDEVSVQPANHDDLHYSEVHFSKNHKDPLNSTIQQDQTQDQDNVPYAVVHFRPKATPE